MKSEPNTLVEDYTQILVDSEEATESFMAALEAILVSVVGRVGIWLTPLPSAFLVSRAADRIFSLGGLSWLMAGIIELVGLVTANLWLNAQEWNRTKAQKDPDANEDLAFGLLVTYFVSTGLMLLAFEIPVIIQTGSLIGLTALLFPCLSAVGIFALNERMLQHRRMSAKAKKKAERKRNEAQPGTALRTEQTEQESVRQYGQTSGTTREKAVEIMRTDPDITGAELGRRLNRSGRLGRRLKAEINGINGTGAAQ